MNTKLILDENAKDDWMKLVKKHKKRQNGLPALSTLNTNAGNVEHNVSMFNKMTSSTEGPSNNPISGPMGGDCVCESFNSDDSVELYYENLTFDYDDSEVTIDWTYDVSKTDLYTYIFESCITEEDFPELSNDSFDPNTDEGWKLYTDWLEDNFDDIYTKYESQILDNWEEEAANEASENYDPDDYVDWDMMTGGHDDYPLWESNNLDDTFDLSTRTLL